MDNYDVAYNLSKLAGIVSEVELKAHALFLENPAHPDARTLDLSNADLTELDLTGVDLRGANLEDANLTETDLEYADLSGAYAPGANFTGASLVHSSLNWAILEGADFTDADLTGADLSDATTQNACFLNATTDYVYSFNLGGPAGWYVPATNRVSIAGIEHSLHHWRAGNFWGLLERTLSSLGYESEVCKRYSAMLKLLEQWHRDEAKPDSADEMFDAAMERQYSTRKI